MLTKNIKFTNFYEKIYTKNKNSNFFSIKILLKLYPLLQSFSKDYKYSYSKKTLNKFKNYKVIRIIGMGGSILGTEAIFQFLKDRIKKKIIFLNNLNPILNSNERALNIIISKSGETLETISNFHIILKDQKKTKNIFITENKNSYIRSLAEKLKSEIIEHRNFIGGRYSVLSEVGMLPSQLVGLKVNKFKSLNSLIKNKKFVFELINNVKSTLKYLKNKKNNSIILNYDERSENLFKWYQQLIAESLGKKSKGIIPIISSMPKDNHSLLQLYLDGPKNNFYTFFNVIENKSNIIKTKFLNNSQFNLNNKKLYDVINAQKVATQRIFKQKKIPFRSFEVKRRSEESISELFCFFVLETILLGKALNVNPFDQPSVELIKIETKKILS